MKPELMEWRLSRVCALHARFLGERCFWEGHPILDVPRFGDEVLQGYLSSYWMRGWLLAQRDSFEGYGPPTTQPTPGQPPRLRVLVTDPEGQEP